MGFSKIVLLQGSKGIRQWSMFKIHKITHSVDYNWWLKRLDTQLNESTNKNSIKAPKVVNKKALF